MLKNPVAFFQKDFVCLAGGETTDCGMEIWQFGNPDFYFFLISSEMLYSVFTA